MLPARWVVLGAAGEAGALDIDEIASSVTKPTVLVMGNEADGLRTNVRRACGALVRVPGGDDASTAMARLVSGTVALAVEAVIAGKIAAGVTAAPSDPGIVGDWLEVIDTQAQHLEIVDHV